MDLYTATEDPTVNLPVTTEMSDYEHIAPGCVYGCNIINYGDKTVPECMDLCDAEPECVAFEYGVDYGGSGGPLDVGECQLQNCDDYQGCDGSQHNLDLYIKLGNSTGTVLYCILTICDVCVSVEIKFLIEHFSVKM